MTQGYVTDDGTFFESKNEAALHEAESRLRGGLAAINPDINADGFLVLVYELRPQIKEYIDAYNTATATKRDQQAEEPDGAAAQHSGEAKADGSVGHVSSTSDDLENLLKLPRRMEGHTGVEGEIPSKQRRKDKVVKARDRA